VLAFERRVVEALTTTPDPAARVAVLDWVDGSLRAMPEHLRAGVLLESVVFATVAGMTRRPVAALVATLTASPIAPVRQYVRLLRSLIIFAEHELAPAPFATPAG
jgi:hypothetical protein